MNLRRKALAWFRKAKKEPAVKIATSNESNEADKKLFDTNLEKKYELMKDFNETKKFFDSLIQANNNNFDLKSNERSENKKNLSESILKMSQISLNNNVNKEEKVIVRNSSNEFKSYLANQTEDSQISDELIAYFIEKIEKNATTKYIRLSEYSMDNQKLPEIKKRNSLMDEIKLNSVKLKPVINDRDKHKILYQKKTKPSFVNNCNKKYINRERENEKSLSKKLSAYESDSEISDISDKQHAIKKHKSEKHSDKRIRNKKFNEIKKRRV